MNKRLSDKYIIYISPLHDLRALSFPSSLSFGDNPKRKEMR